jgi:hypothetical protein
VHIRAREHSLTCTTVKQWNETDVNACLDRILVSLVFARAQRQKRLLRYLVGQMLAGRTKRLKGYTIKPLQKVLEDAG